MIRLLRRFWAIYWLPILFTVLFVGVIHNTPSERMTQMFFWDIGRGLVFFYMLWRIIRNGELAVERLEERDLARLDVLKSAEEYAAKQVRVADDARNRQEAIARELVTKTDKASQVVQQFLNDIKNQLQEAAIAQAANTELTKQAGEASSEAAHIANNMNQKIKETHETVIDRLREMAKSTAPINSAEVSLQHIDEQTAEIAKNTAISDATLLKTVADVKKLKEKGKA